MKKVNLKKEFVMEKAEVEAYNALPDNTPETKLTAKQAELVKSLYWKYIRRIDNLDWSPSLVSIELSEKWPSGPRMKEVQAMRIVLNNLVNEQSRNGTTLEKAMQHFFIALTCRPAYARLVSKIWDVQF